MFLILFLLLLSSFDEIYDDLSRITTTNGTQVYCKSSYNYKFSHLDLSYYNKAHVTHSVFQNIITSMSNIETNKHGGAINYDIDGDILIEYTTFYNIRNQGDGKIGYGGALYIQCNNCILYSVCGSKCFTKLYGNFFYTFECIKSTYFKLVSVCNCPKEGDYNIVTYSTQTNITNVNISKNEINNYCPALAINSYSDKNIYLEYSTISSNSGVERCICLTTGNSCINYCNIINNKCRKTFFVKNCNVIIQNCCILNNTNYNFALEDTWSIILYKTCISTKITNTGIQTIEVFTNISDYFVNVLHLYNTYYCKSGLDIVYSITPGTKYVPTPYQTPCKSPEETLVDTPVETPIETPCETPIDTPIDTPCETPCETPIDTPVETLYESSTEKKYIMIIIILSAFIVLIIIAMVLVLLIMLYRRRRIMKNTENDTSSVEIDLNNTTLTYNLETNQDHKMINLNLIPG